MFLREFEVLSEFGFLQGVWCSSGSLGFMSQFWVHEPVLGS